MPFRLMILHLSHIFLTDGLTFIINSFTRQIGKAALATMTLRPLRKRARHAGAASTKTASLFHREGATCLLENTEQRIPVDPERSEQEASGKNRYESDKPLTTLYSLSTRSKNRFQRFLH